MARAPSTPFNKSPLSFADQVQKLQQHGMHILDTTKAEFYLGHLSCNHNTAHPHLQPPLFHNPLVYGASIIKLANDVRNSKEDFIKHLSSRYEELLPPIWASVELMTMGQQRAIWR